VLYEAVKRTGDVNDEIYMITNHVSCLIPPFPSNTTGFSVYNELRASLPKMAQFFNFWEFQFLGETTVYSGYSEGSEKLTYWVP